MPITFGYLLVDWEYVYNTNDKDKLIIMAHTQEKFYEELKHHGYYDQYLESISPKPIKDVPKGKNLSIYDFIEENE